MSTIYKVIASISHKSIIFLFRFIHGSRIEEIFIDISKQKKIDLLLLAHHSIGIQVAGSCSRTGESYFIKHVLPSIITNKKPLFFDVGANVGGEYIDLLANKFPQSKIIAFEPNSHSFEELKKNAPKGVLCEKIGIGEKKKRIKLYSYVSAAESELASVDKNILKHINPKSQITSEQIVITTIDSYCNQNKFSYIDFLKIDIEGNEYNALIGAKNLLKKSAIKCIQFEFNEHNIFSRVTLRDFYLLLENYDIYRICSTGLINLKKYNTINEVYKFQNIAAILKS